MGKFSDCLLASDFDFTLTNHDGSIPKRNLDAIADFMDGGGLFCVASGRSVELLRKRIAAVPYNAPCLCFNGAACYDYRTESLLYAQTLPDSAVALLEAAFEFDPNIGAEVQKLDGHYSFSYSTTRAQFLQSQGIAAILATRENPPSLPWMKLVLCPPSETHALKNLKETSPEISEYMQRLEKAMYSVCGESCYITRSMPRLMEIGAAGFNKGDSARKLAGLLGRNILVCAGDAPNDAQMLAEADFAFAPGDCDAEIRSIAGLRLTDPCDAGAVAGAIAQLESLL